LSKAKFHTSDNQASQHTIYPHLPQYDSNPTTCNRFRPAQVPETILLDPLPLEVRLIQNQKPETSDI